MPPSLPRRAALLAALPALLQAAGCVPRAQYDSMEQQYNQLNASLSGEIASDQVHITRLQGAIKVTVNSELLFPEGGWAMPPAVNTPPILPEENGCRSPIR